MVDERELPGVTSALSLLWCMRCENEHCRTEVVYFCSLILLLDSKFSLFPRPVVDRMLPGINSTKIHEVAVNCPPTSYCN